MLNLDKVFQEETSFEVNDNDKTRKRVRKEAKMIMDRYNQIPHLTQDLIRGSDKKKTRKHHIQERQEVSLFSASDH